MRAPYLCSIAAVALVKQRDHSPAMPKKEMPDSGCCEHMLQAALLCAGRGAIKVHGGFYNGAKRHLGEIATVVHACDERAGRRLPVWVTGHSLGGGYANALALHLLAQRNTAELFGAGQCAASCRDAASINPNDADNFIGHYVLDVMLDVMSCEKRLVPRKQIALHFLTGPCGQIAQAELSGKLVSLITQDTTRLTGHAEEVLPMLQGGAQ